MGKANIQVDSGVKKLVQGYYNKLANRDAGGQNADKKKETQSSDEEVEKKKKFIDNLSYLEVS
jgi:hypothetical protein